VRAAGAAAVLLLLSAGCGNAGGDGAVVVEGGMAVLDAWTRPSPATADEAAIYVTIENRDAPDDRLIGAESERCVVVTPHLTELDDDDVARMSEAGTDQLGLGAGETVEMSPNGLHLMCLGMSRPLDDGERIPLTLRFAEHAPVTVEVQVEQR
jgi:copper(I)-binding protein